MIIILHQRKEIARMIYCIVYVLHRYVGPQENGDLSHSQKLINFRTYEKERNERSGAHVKRRRVNIVVSCR